ncbi:MAG: crotonase/enoyl-CoA hydratase family protein [Gammaproteobacteria bacterium]|nr:crotonase/enoyl-CoA hydratase family protein [Gammaproteobacteria bacterium]
MTDAVLVEKRGDITLISLNRAQAKNAVDRPTAEALADAFHAFEEDDSAKVAVFYGQHSTFCAGADLKALASGDMDRVNRLEEKGDGPMGPSRMLLTKPVIAAIEGFAVAGGMELALWCDMRVMAEDAVMGIFCRRWGVPLIDGGTVRLPRLIGLSRALDLILTGRPVKAEEAERIGLVNRVAASGKSLDVALELAQQLCEFPQTCMREDRLSAYEQFGLDLDEAMMNEFRRGRMSIASGDLIAGAGKFAAGAGRGGSFTDHGDAAAK